MSTGPRRAQIPRFSIVTAVYDVEPYLPDFIASIEAQRFDLGRVEVIAVDDGSTDGSLAILEAWAKRRPELVKVLTQPNGGQGSARNLGLDSATGEWVTFTDPDDMLDPDFFEAVERFTLAHPDVQLMASKPVLIDGRTGRLADRHPRRAQYDAGDRMVSLDREPNTFLGTGASGLFRLDRIRDEGLRFDPRIRPNFEDGHFAARYLLSLPSPELGLLGDARYLYRKRSAGDSTLQQAPGHPGRYTDVLRFGYLDIFERALAQGVIPAWIQHLVLYELSWYLTADDKISSDVRMAPEAIAPFHDLLGRILVQMDPAVIQGHTARPLKSVWVDIFQHAYRAEDWHSLAAVRTRIDRAMGLQRVCYRYVGTPPGEEFLVDGASVQPAFGKTMPHVYYGRALVQERIAWLPLHGSLRVLLSGDPVDIQEGWPEPGSASSSTAARARRPPRGRRSAAGLAASTRRRASGFLKQLSAAVTRRAARGWPYRSQFRDAWALMDRIYGADDNAERLFEYVRAERPDINAWFVIERGTPDWRRLRAAGVPRVVAHGSFRWKMLMLNCSWLVTSHADRAIAQPPRILASDRPTWRYAFLQHGVIKDDLSQWLNRYDIDLFVVSTQAEFESITADGTCYAFTAKETRKTGLPRFDRLLAKGREVGPDDRDLILVAPTWRTYLTLPGDPTTQRRAIDEGFWDSEYLRAWTGILRSPEVATAAAQRGLTVAFMPHPNIQPVLPRMELPPHVVPLTFADQDVQGLYARCALLVTDYSSVAFNTAYIDRPVVYYQFDRDVVMRGAHLGRKGYFDYERDGFGPVALDEAAAIRAVVEAIEHGPRPTSEYQARIDRTFTERDGQACARVVAAIEEMSRPYRAPDGTPTA